MSRPIELLPKPKSWKYTVREAWDKFACARCGASVHPATNMIENLGEWSDVERSEYWISGMCRKCQDWFFNDTGDDA